MVFPPPPPQNYFQSSSFQELFSAIGPIKRAKFVKKGIADVVFVKLEDARNAMVSYNNKLLDGRELKIELITKIPISEKLSNIAPVAVPAQVLPLVSNYQYIKNTHTVPIKAAIPYVTPLPQRPVRPTISMETTTSQINNSNFLSKRFSNLNNNTVGSNMLLQQQQHDQQLQKNVVKPNLPSASSKVTVETSVIHQALFTNTKTNPNPVTFTVKI